jgi:hypothetical protein
MFDPSRVAIGMNRAAVREALGEPDQVGGRSNRQRMPLLWKYGDVELAFNPAGELWLIYRETATGDPEILAQRAL